MLDNHPKWKLSFKFRPNLEWYIGFNWIWIGLAIFILYFFFGCAGIQRKAEMVNQSYQIDTPYGLENWKLIKCSPRTLQEIFDKRNPKLKGLSISGFADGYSKEIWYTTEESKEHHIRLIRKGWSGWKKEYQRDVDALIEQNRREFWRD